MLLTKHLLQCRAIRLLFSYGDAVANESVSDFEGGGCFAGLCAAIVVELSVNVPRLYPREFGVAGVERHVHRNHTFV